MLPSDQCFDCGDASGDEVHLRLEVQGEGVACDGVAQMDLDVVAKFGFGVHLLGEQGDVVPASAFGYQGGLICLPQKRLRGVLARLTEGDSDARASADAFDSEGDGGVHGVGDHLGVVCCDAG